MLCNTQLEPGQTCTTLRALLKAVQRLACSIVQHCARVCVLPQRFEQIRACIFWSCPSTCVLLAAHVVERL